MLLDFEYGLMPSMSILNRRLHTSSLNLSGHVSSIWFMVIQYIGIHDTPSSLLCDAGNPPNIDNYLQLKSLWILGIIDMWLNILWGETCALALLFDSLYLSCPNSRHIYFSPYFYLYRINALGHACYDIYSTTNIFNILFSSSQLPGKTLSFRSTLYLNNL